MRSSRTTILLGAISTCLVIVFALPVLAQPTHLDLVGTAPKQAGIPPDGSAWHELVPVFCQMYTQTDYLDNGDGVISICDWMNLMGPDGQVFGYHIEWVGPTYWVDWNGDGQWDDVNDVIYEPIEPYGFDQLPQYCDWWYMIYPWTDPPEEWHVTDYQDNGDGIPSHCDWVWFDAVGLHIVDVTVNVRLGPPGPPVAVEKGTWGQIKNLYDE